MSGVVQVLLWGIVACSAVVVLTVAALAVLARSDAPEQRDRRRPGG